MKSVLFLVLCFTVCLAKNIDKRGLYKEEYVPQYYSNHKDLQHQANALKAGYEIELDSIPIHNHLAQLSHTRYAELSHSLSNDFSLHEGKIDLGETVDEQYIIKQKIGVPVSKPYYLKIEKNIPVPVHHTVPVPIDQPYPVHVPEPYPVVVENHIKVPVDTPVSYSVPVPVEFPVSVPYQVPVPETVALPEHKAFAIHVSDSVFARKEIPVKEPNNE